MGTEIGFFRNTDNLVTGRPAEALAKNGIRADWITAASLIAGVAGQIMVLKNRQVSSQLESLSRGRIKISPSATKWLGVGLVALGFYGDILDGAVAKRQNGGPTKNGGRWDHLGDRAVDSAFATIEMTGHRVDSSRRGAAEINQALIARPSELRAIANKFGIWVPEIDPGSRFLRFFSFMGALMSEEYRTCFLNINSAQSAISVAMRYALIRRSGNKQAIQVADNALLGILAYNLTRIDEPTSWWRSIVSQVVATTPSIMVKMHN